MRVWVFVIAALLAFATAVGAEERITSYVVDVTVNRDGSLDLAETIAVVGENKDVKRGTLRDIPVVRDIEGVRVSADFELKSLMRDGKVEPYALKRSGDKIVLRIGDPNVFIGAGTFTYFIQYRLTRQLLFYPDRNVLYWSPVATGWSFPVEKADVTVHLPSGAEVLAFEGFTGYAGETGRDYRVRSVPPGDLALGTTRRLEPSEGLSIMLAWKPGIIVRDGQDL